MEELDVSVVEKVLGSVIKELEYRRILFLKRG